MPKKPATMPAPELNPSAAPKTTPSMKHKEPSAQYQYPKAGEQSMAPSTKKTGLPSQDAPPGVKGVNGGSPAALPTSGKPGESKV